MPWHKERLLTAKKKVTSSKSDNPRIFMLKTIVLSDQGCSTNYILNMFYKTNFFYSTSLKKLMFDCCCVQILNAD